MTAYRVLTAITFALWLLTCALAALGLPLLAVITGAWTLGAFIWCWLMVREARE